MVKRTVISPFVKKCSSKGRKRIITYSLALTQTQVLVKLLSINLKMFFVDKGVQGLIHIPTVESEFATFTEQSIIQNNAKVCVPQAYAQAWLGLSHCGL